MKNVIIAISIICAMCTLTACTDMVGEDGLDGKKVAEKVESAIESAKDSDLIKDAEGAFEDFKESDLASSVVEEYNKAKEKIEDSEIVEEVKGKLNKAINQTSARTDSPNICVLPYNKNKNYNLYSNLPSTGMDDTDSIILLTTK